jgi:peptide/nickel transport system substrate-binding protein
MRKKAMLAGASLATLTLLAGCFGGSSDSGEVQDKTKNEVDLPSDGPAEDGGVITVTDTSDSPSLDVQKTASAYTHLQLSGIVYSKLLDFKTGRDLPYGSMEVKGDLAESWERSEDGLTWTFNLRKNVKWHNVAPVNGRAFTSADVVCTMDRIKTLPGVQKNLIDIVDTIDAPDDHTVVFNLGTPYAAFDETVASYFMEIIPCEGARGEYDLATTAIGTGPFVLEKWERKVEKTYVKNQDYFIEGKPHLDGVKIVIQGDPAATIAAFRTEQVDATGSISDTLIPTVTSSNQDAVVRYQLGLTMPQITFNQANKPFDDLRVRKAVAMAWDRQGMGETFYGGGFELSGPFPSTLFGGMSPEESEEINPYDPDAAKKLLAEAGYPNGFDLEIMTTDGYGPTVVNAAQWVQEDLKKIGINATLEILDYATFFSTFQAEDYQMTFGLSTGFLTADEWLESVWKSNGTRNWFNTNDPEADRLIDEQRSILDTEEREQALEELSTYLQENVLNPIMGMQYTGLLVSHPYVHNMYTHPAYARGYMADVWLDSNAPTRG